VAISNRALIVKRYCPHGQTEPHLSSSEGRCEHGREITLDGDQAVRLAQGYVINVSEIIEAVLNDGVRPRA
jgi:hypothetical protein